MKLSVLLALHPTRPKPISTSGNEIFCQRADPVQGSDLCHWVFGDNAIKQHKQFKAFFSLQDPMKPAPTRKEHPTYKVDSFLKHLQQVSMKAWRLGQNIPGDEQTIGFQGRHADKLRITYKAEGDGFQCNALADSGFTWTFFSQSTSTREMDQERLLTIAFSYFGNV